METLEFNLTNKNLEDIIKEQNIFKDPYESIWVKFGATISYLMGVPVVTILYDFIQKEVNDQHKTIFNLLLAYTYFAVICFLTICVGVDLARIWIGPFPVWICQLQNITKGALFISFFGTLFAIFALRFFFVVVWSKMKITKDYLLAAIIIRTTLLLGKFHNLISAFLIGFVIWID